MDCFWHLQKCVDSFIVSKKGELLKQVCSALKTLNPMSLLTKVKSDNSQGIVSEFQEAEQEKQSCLVCPTNKQ